MTAEEERLQEAREGTAAWRQWGPYLSERQWGTVREDYSAEGTPWEYFPHDHARSRAYRWGEDGIAGICDNRQRLCFAIALWNEADPILKERLFGLTGHEGNHGEDVKECYFYLDNVPTHAYMKYLYKYPQQTFPYADLVETNRRRTRDDPEYELLDTGIFDENRYFDVTIEYAKAAPDDLLIRITAANRGTEAAPLHVLPTLWFRNDWAWKEGRPKPRIALERARGGVAVLAATHQSLGSWWLYCEKPGEVLFTENETNSERLFGVPNPSPYVKDGIHDCIVAGKRDAVDARQTGTKASPHHTFAIRPGEPAVVRLRLSAAGDVAQPFGPEFDAQFTQRLQEADAFYQRITPFELPPDMRNVQRQAFAGMLWSKQYYGYFVDRWLEGDPVGPPPAEERKRGRNHQWWHLTAEDVLSMPDKWEYPWFAAWDMAFHAIAFAMIDPDYAKRQLLVLTREWYMHPNGQLPAYEWDFSDVNPPVHAWAALRIYQIEQKHYGRTDRDFLERIFQKLLINFTWWVNRKDAEGRNIFEGGFLGLDNISVFDRTAGLPGGGRLEQADGTSWMAMYCLNLLALALELAQEDHVYEDVATKFFEHFVYIGSAINKMGGQGLWNPADGYYYDQLRLPDGRCIPIKAHTISGLIPVFAVAVGDGDAIARFADFARRLRWFAKHRPELLHGLGDLTQRGAQNRVRLALVDTDKLKLILARVLDPERMLSPHGIRSVSKFHREHPLRLDVDGQEFTLDYAPAESRSPLFGGNSNWRGPVWFPLNFLLIEALQKHDFCLGEAFTVEFPVGSQNEMTLWEVTTEMTRRLITLFTRDENGRRPVNGSREKLQSDPHWRDLILFYEYFNGDTGEGLGASHQTGWTGVVAKLIHQYAEYALRAHPELGEEFGFGAFRERK